MLSKINNKFTKLNPFTIFSYFVLLFIMLFSVKSLVNIFTVFLCFIIVLFIYIERTILKKSIVFFTMLLFIPFFLNYVFTRNLENSLISSLTLTSFFLLFVLLNYFLDDTKIIHLFYKLLPKTALVISISLRYNVLIIKKYKEIYSTFTANNNENQTFKQRLNNTSDIFLSVFNIALEDSITLSKSIQSKSYFSNKRTYYNNFSFTKNDISILIILLIIFFKGSIVLFIFAPVVYDFTLNTWRVIKCSLA